MRATKPKSYRPLSQSLSSGPDMMHSFDSEDDLLKEFTASNTPNTSGATSSMALLAENYRKLEKSGKLKNWNIAKVKTPRKSSLTQLSGKFSKSYQALNRRFRSDSTRSAKSSVERDAHSDNEDTENSSETPLLHGGSSTFLPPPKPPRTFKQRKLDLTGDGDVENVLLYEDDDFSGDVLSAIKEMGVVAVLGRESSEESSEERFSKSLPNGGIQILCSSCDSSSQSSPTGRISPTPPLLSPRTVSPLASEPPARAILPPPALSPVHEGVSQTLKQKPSVREDSSTADNPASSTSTVDSHQTTVVEGPTDIPASETEPETNPHSGADISTGTNGDTVVPDVTTEEKVGSPTSDGASPSTEQVSSEKPADANSDDSFSEFQSAPPAVPMGQKPMLPRAASVDELEQNVRSPGKDISLREAASLSFDESKRMSMISVASGDWYSLGEEEEEEDNISNYSAEFPELECAVGYDAPVCPNPIDEEHHLFSTPPSSPPLPPDGTLKKGARVGSSSERSASNSPRPKSASPLGHRPRRSPPAVESLLRRSCSPRPKSAGSRTSSSRGSTYEEALVEAKEESVTTVHQNHSAGSKCDAKSPDKVEEDGEEGETKESPKDSSEAAAAAESLVVREDTSAAITDAPPTEAKGGDDKLDDSDETFEDAAEDSTSLEESCEMAASESAVSVDATLESLDSGKKCTPQKSQSANTSPSTADARKNTSSSSLTRSATDLGCQTKTKTLHTRSRSSTVSTSSTAANGHLRSLQEAPDRSKDEEYFTKLIQKSGKKVKETASGVTAFSDQDFADILRSSMRGESKVPMVRVESADDEGDVDKRASVVSDEKYGSEGKVDGEGGRVSDNHLQAPCGDSSSPEASAAEPVEAVVIPDDTSPNMVSKSCTECTYSRS